MRILNWFKRLFKKDKSLLIKNYEFISSISDGFKNDYVLKVNNDRNVKLELEFEKGHKLLRVLIDEKLITFLTVNDLKKMLYDGELNSYHKKFAVELADIMSLFMFTDIEEEFNKIDKYLGG